MWICSIMNKMTVDLRFLPDMTPAPILDGSSVWSSSDSCKVYKLGFDSLNILMTQDLWEIRIELRCQT